MGKTKPILIEYLMQKLEVYFKTQGGQRKRFDWNLPSKTLWKILGISAESYNLALHNEPHYTTLEILRVNRILKYDIYETIFEPSKVYIMYKIIFCIWIQKIVRTHNMLVIKCADLEKDIGKSKDLYLRKINKK